MFGSSRRHRPPNPPLTAATANPNAASAAAAVFKRNEAQQASNLSAAAAAAALRARPITPTNVAEVQTKRTVRRSASVASTRTNPETRGRPDLRRSGSSSSMTERTFRSPSPHRPDSRNSGHQSQSIDELPPVPELPKNVATTVGTTMETGAPQKSAHRRTQSLGVERAPSQKQLGADDARPWFGPAKVGDLSSVRRTDPAMASPPSSPPQVAMHQEDRPNSRASSVNFSYPARVRVGSPPVSPADTRSTTDFPAQDSQSAVQPQRSRSSLLLEPGTPSSSTRPRASSASAADQTLVYDPNSRRMIRRSNLIAVEHAIIAASQQPTRSKKKKQHLPKPGSHLAQGTVGRTKSNVPTSDQTGNTGTATTTRTTAPQIQVPALVQQSPAIQDSRQETQERPPSPSVVTLPAIELQPTKQPHEEDSDIEEEEEDVITDHHHPTTSTPMVVNKDGRPMVRRLPSIVREEPELEESESDEANTLRVSSALDSVPSRQRIVSHTRSQSEQQPIQSSSQASQLPIRAASVSQRKNQPTRNSSISPARQAHFGPVQDTLTIRHSPPPRSVSPRKSALKQTSPVRGPSPSDLSSEASWSTDQPVKRKKSVRVSFDDETQPAIVEAAPKERSISPPLASPTGIRRWANADSSAALDNEELMKPRPALPSFGSVRNVRKPQQQEAKEDERPLRPIGDISYTAPYTTPLPLSPVAESFAQSSDYVIDGVLQREREERVRSPANISRFREPLPPVVTSVEGSGYASDDSDGSTSLASEMTGSLYDYPSFMDPPPQPRRNSLSSPQVSPVKTAFTNGNAPAIDSRFAQEEARRRNSAPNIPVISLTQPTPPATQTEAPRPFFVEVPGGFPEDSDTSKSSTNEVEQATGQQTTGTHSQQPSGSESDDSSVYADAYEDLSEAEGEGFQSLNAVLDFPGTNNSRQQREIPDTSSPPDPPRSLVPALSTATTAIGSHSGESPQEDDWERAKAYWRSLTAERRAQLEREAKEDAGIEGDREEISVPEEKPRRKKSIERKNSERQALAVQMARQMMLEQQQQQQPSQPQDEQPRKKKKGKTKETAATAPASVRVSPERTYQIKPGTKWEEPEVPVAPVASTMTMRTTMRSAPHQPKATAVNDGPRLRKSLRSEPPADRRASYPDPAPVPATSQLTKRERRAASEAATAPRASTIRLASTHQSHIKRRGSTSSESSFKRARASSAGTGLSAGGFPKSLRPKSPAAGSVDSYGSGTKLLTSLRSMTPTNSNSRLDSPPSSRGTMGSGMGMRTTLRDSAANSGGGRRSPSGMKMPTLGKKGGGAGGKKRSSTGSKFSSRFGDSSDEEDAPGTASRFRSRFDESSDEEEVVPPVPVVPSGLKGSASAPVAAAARSMALGSMRDRQVSIAEEEDDYRNRAVVNGNGNARGSVVGSSLGGGHHKLSKSARLGSAIPSQQQAGYDDDEEVAAGNEELRRTRSGRGQILPTSQTAPNVCTSEAPAAAAAEQHRPKRGLMSVFSRKKHHHQHVQEGADAITRPEAPVESAARKDTKLERSKAELKGLRNQGPVDLDQDREEINVPEERLRTPATIDTNTSEISPKSHHPRLQKRGSRMPSLSLPGRSDKAPVVEESINGGGIPMPGFIRRSGTTTAGPTGSLGTRSISGGSGPNGPFAAAAPGLLGPRRASTATALSAAGTELPERSETPTSSGKKKKFGGALRRMFGRSGDKEGSG